MLASTRPASTTTGPMRRASKPWRCWALRKADMSIMLTEVYDALKAAQVPEKVARDGAHALGEVVSDMRLLKWMVGTFGVVIVGMVAGLYVLLFNVVSRLPR